MSAKHGVVLVAAGAFFLAAAGLSIFEHLTFINILFGVLTLGGPP